MNEALCLSAAGESFLRQQEGCRLTAYLDTHAVPTIGVGHTGKLVHIGQVCTREQAELWLADDAKWAENTVKHFVKVELSQAEFDALVSFVFNEGSGHFEESTLLEVVNAKGTPWQITQAFGEWVYINHHKSDDLIRRRAAEADIFCGRLKLASQTMGAPK